MVMLTADELLESMVTLSAWVAVCAVGVVESVTFTVKLYVPACVGVPEISPLEAVRAKPGGRRPELMVQLYGVTPPVAASVEEYAVPTLPVGIEVLVICTFVGGAAATLMLSGTVAVWAGEEES